MTKQFRFWNLVIGICLYLVSCFLPARPGYLFVSHFVFASEDASDSGDITSGATVGEPAATSTPTPTPTPTGTLTPTPTGEQPFPTLPPEEPPPTGGPAGGTGDVHLTIFGYTAPNSPVTAEGVRVIEETQSDELGYFKFNRVWLPGGKVEVCLTSINDSIATQPVCLPELPRGQSEINVGPVLLPPSVSLDKNHLLTGEQVKAQGLAIPNSTVTVYLANNSINSNFKFQISNLVPSAYAFSLPQYTLETGPDGRYEFNLPANYPTTWTLHAGADYNGAPTPISNILTFHILTMVQGWLTVFVELLQALWATLHPHLVEILIGIEALFLMCFLAFRTLVKKKYYLLVRPRHEIVKTM